MAQGLLDGYPRDAMYLETTQFHFGGHIERCHGGQLVATRSLYPLIFSTALAFVYSIVAVLKLLLLILLKIFDLLT